MAVDVKEQRTEGAGGQGLRYVGKVEKWDGERGWGFIVYQGPDGMRATAFVHHSESPMPLRAGDEVEFGLRPAREPGKAPCAVEVVLTVPSSAPTGEIVPHRIGEDAAPARPAAACRDAPARGGAADRAGTARPGAAAARPRCSRTARSGTARWCRPPGASGARGAPRTSPSSRSR